MEKPVGIVAVLEKDGRFLAIRRGPDVPFAGHWAPLSGRVEAGETQEETVVREVREEVGLDVSPLEKVWECDTDDGDFRLHWWTARINGGELDLEPSEVSEARWVTPAEFLELKPTFAGDREFVERVLPTI